MLGGGTNLSVGICDGALSTARSSFCFAIILMGKSELFAFFKKNSPRCFVPVGVMWLFITVLWVVV